MNEKVEPLTRAEIESIKACVSRSGYYKTADQLGITYQVLLRALGGLGLRDGSILMIRRGLENS